MIRVPDRATNVDGRFQRGARPYDQHLVRNVGATCAAEARCL